MNSVGGALGGGYRGAFTALQWQELEHQALIFKYFMAGVPVPPDLLLPIRKSFDALASRFYQYPTLGYGSFYGKKFDPEPGRCRRTDGKKWRCSKDAHPESKYCERHMHRGRNRSRKPVEMPTSLSQQQQSPSPSPSSSSTVTSLTAVGSNAVAGGSSGGGSINIVGNRGSAGNGGGMGPYYNNSTSVATTTHGGFFSGQVDSGSYLAMGNTNNNNKSYSFLTEAGSGSSKGRNVCSTQLSFQDLGQESVGYLSRQQQHSFLGNEFGCSSPVVPPPPQTQHHQPKQENQQQSLLPFFDEWPKTKDSWFDIEDEKPNRTASFSTTQLSMSTPIASSDYSTTSSRSLTEN
ncbi:Growth-regulating factor 4 [Zostera marina]|uniref:Growth-regulating factor n=1 Tax=Zostera marina TaxID=29655 RepID=A0A0K9Q0T1_ZOSMR|nr:Growth-regulating factor 4 [Zostera marina]